MARQGVARGVRHTAQWLLVGAVVLGGAVAAWVLSTDDAPLASGEQDRRSAQALAATTRKPPRDVATLRVELRSKGKQGAKKATVWDGEIKVTEGRLRGVRAWQPDPRNAIDGARWKLTTRHTIPWNSQQRKRGHKAMPLKDNALLIELGDASARTRCSFETEQGAFSFRLSDIPFGATKPFLRGLVQVSRAASSVTMLSAPTEDDYPSAALGGDGELFVAYTSFTHGEGYRRRGPLPEAPKDLEPLARPTGGDQVLLLRLDDDQWTDPLPVTPPGRDVYRTALAVDDSERAWVFWSENRRGNWDVYARRLGGDRFADEVRLSDDPGSDSFPVATADSEGRVWVVWQAFRDDGDAAILARRQKGDDFEATLVIADSPANEWSPAIAAAKDGRIAITWDSYAAGDYDVWCRVVRDGKLDPSIPIATSRRAEMRPAATFDGAGRLWVAYEDSPEDWGKDFGALEKSGSPLYRGRSIGVRVVDDGKLLQPADDPVYAFRPWLRNRKNAAKRTGVLRFAVPRLTTDVHGRVWLAVRSPHLGTRVGVGSTWFEHVAFYDGDKWSRDIACPGTDNILDNRPALVPLPSGEIQLVASSDGRFATSARLPGWFVRELRKSGTKVKQMKLAAPWPDPVNNELTLATVGPAPKPAGVAVSLVPAPEAAAKKAPATTSRDERGAIARARAARATVGGKTLRLWRGEFHRHTEISSDGGGDGLLLDMWRYGIDAASLDWIGNGDHDNGGGREYSWWLTQKTTDLFEHANSFTPMYTYERSCVYPDGHRNVVFAQRGVRTLPRLRGGMGKSLDEKGPDAKRPPTPDTQLLYRYLAHFDGVCASHTSGTDMGTDWRDNDPAVEPIVEIYQGCRQSYEMPGAPRSNTADHSLGGWRPFGFVSLALEKGYRLGFQASSDHTSTHISYCNVWVEEPTRDAILVALKARHVYGATVNIVAEFRCGEHFMGDEFTTNERPRLSVRLVGTQPFASVHVIKDGKHAHSIEPRKQTVEFEWTDFDAAPGKTSYYYVRGEQVDGELVWVSPMWIAYAL